MMDAHQEAAWPADRVERRAVASLVPYAPIADIAQPRCLSRKDRVLGK